MKDAGFSEDVEAAVPGKECRIDRLPYNVLENIMRLMNASPWKLKNPLDTVFSA